MRTNSNAFIPLQNDGQDSHLAVGVRQIVDRDPMRGYTQLGVDEQVHDSGLKFGDALVFGSHLWAVFGFHQGVE